MPTTTDEQAESQDPHPFDKEAWENVARTIREEFGISAGLNLEVGTLRLGDEPYIGDSGPLDWYEDHHESFPAAAHTAASEAMQAVVAQAKNDLADLEADLAFALED